MSFRAFEQTLVYERKESPGGRSRICCLDCCDQDLYFGTGDGSVQHLVLRGRREAQEGRARKLSNAPILQLQVLWGHLLVLSDRSLSALHRFSLDPVPTLQKIQQVSSFASSDALLVTSRRKLVRIHAVTPDRWEVVREVPLRQEVLALAVQGSSVCVATRDQYLLCDADTGTVLELFTHDVRQSVVVASGGGGEFLIHGPGSLGVFVMTTGVCHRPPLRWSEDVLDARVSFPYVVALRPSTLTVYSLLDQQHKQSLSLGATSLSSTTDAVLVSTDRKILLLHQVPLEDQIQTLVRDERAEEALKLLDSLHDPVDTQQEVWKSLACLLGFLHLHQESFSEAKDLFTRGELDPREILHLFPDLRAVLGPDFQAVHGDNKCRDLQARWREDGNTLGRYLVFLGDFLSTARGTALQCRVEVDSALLRLYVEQGDSEKVQELLSSLNCCSLDLCGPVLEEHDRYCALGLLHLSHGRHRDALKIWMKVADGDLTDSSSSDVFGHIVQTVTVTTDRDTVWTFADWILNRDQDVGVQIFTKRPPGVQLESGEVVGLLEKHPRALVLYLEWLTEDLRSEEEAHHSRLALAYVSRALQEDLAPAGTRDKLQRFLWNSKFYCTDTVYEQVKETPLHLEKAILLGRTGRHSEALQMLLEETRDPRVAEFYCRRAGLDQSEEVRTRLLLDLLRLYVTSDGFASSAVDLLDRNRRSFPPERVVDLLPGSWSVQLVSRFLVGSLREVLHQRRTTEVQRALARAEILRHKTTWMETSKLHFRVDELRLCPVCQRDFSEYQFTRGLQGALMHEGCRPAS